jgi:hypothetical protein
MISMNKQYAQEIASALLEAVDALSSDANLECVHVERLGTAYVVTDDVQTETSVCCIYT